MPVTVQTPVPEQSPLHPTNAEPDAAAAFNATDVTSSNWAEQVVPQLMPPGVDVTVPLPLPSLLIVIVITGLSVMTRAMGGPGASVTLGSVPPKIFVPAPSSAATVMVRLDPVGA